MVGAESRVTGRTLMDIFRERGLRRIYMVGGPRLFHTLLADQVVQRLYLTLAGRLIGGDDIETPVRGPLFATPRGPPPPFDLGPRRLAATAVRLLRSRDTLTRKHAIPMIGRKPQS